MPNRIDRNANSLDRLRRSMQRLTQGAIVSTIPAGTYLPANTPLHTTGPVQGGGFLSTGLTVSLLQATSTANGYLTSTDWTTFNSKLAGNTTLTTTAPVTGGGNLSTGLTLGLSTAAVFSTVAGALNFAAEASTLVFAGPSTGAAAIPTFRSLVAGDIPDLAYVDSVSAGDASITVGGATDTPTVTVQLKSTGGLFTSTGGVGINLATSSGLQIVNNQLSVQAADSSITVTSTGIKANSSGGGAGYVLKNRLINGNFDIWQRGTSFSPTGTYTADRWKIHPGTGTCSTVQYAMTQTEVGSTVMATYGLHFKQLTLTGGQPYIEQPIEFVNVLQGQPVTVSFWAKYITNSTGLAQVQLYQDTYGTTVLGNPVLSSTWQKFTYAATLPTTGGTYGANYLRLEFLCSSTTTNSEFVLAQVQLEPGSTATDFEYRPFSMELALCQRYYERSYAIGQATGATNSLGPAIVPNSVSSLAAGVAGNVGNGSVLGFKVEKRAAPTVTFYDFSGAINGTHVNNTNGTDTDRDGATAGPVNASGNLQYIVYDSSGGVLITRNSCIFAHWTADAELS